ncbi:T9SS type A sorting domain-containing protein, partial [Bacteroidota bacterium]
DNDNNGIYDPSFGDYPLIKGDQSIYYIYNDARNIHTETGGSKVNVEIHVMAYAFNCNGPLGNTIFVNYKIYNRSTFNLFNTSIGVFTDLDLGFPYDDFIACDVKRGSFYCYNGDSIDGNGLPPSYGTQPPSQAVVVLGGPYMNSDGIDNPKIDSLGNPLCDNSINGLNFGDGITDNERLGLTKFYQYGINTNTPIYQPVPPSYYYNYVKGYLHDSTRISFGGSGHIYGNPPAYGPACNFMFPGDTDPCNWGTGGVVPNGPVYWSEESTGNVPYDRRSISVTGPFSFAAGQMHELDLAYVWAKADAGGPFASVELMRLAIDSVRYYFINDSTPCEGSFTDVDYKTWEEDIIQDFNIYPNPSNDKITIMQSSDIEYNRYEIFDIIGKSVVSGKLEELTIVNINILPNGLYFVKAFNKNRVSTKNFIKN